MIEEGERISADARLVEGSLEVDMSTLTGESTTVLRVAGPEIAEAPPLEAENLISAEPS